MCGIAGFFTDSFFDKYQSMLQEMTNAISHRGPDAQGHWFDQDIGIGLGHRRLSIIDLSNTGAQPMESQSGRYVVVFNGELYNHNSVRIDLERLKVAPNWRGHSDTETLLAAVDVWGFEQTLKRFTGMFAIALWDRKDRKLLLARDRAGEKPLYYGFHQNTFLFGSELKAVKASPNFKGEINRDVLALYFQYNAIPDPYCIYSGFFKLIPGTILEISEEHVKNAILPEPSAFWSLSDVVEEEAKKFVYGKDGDIVNELESLLTKSINDQTISDVPLGAFLSGGIDSSTIVAIMQANSSKRIQTFTIGFDVAGYNEAEQAKKVASYLGTDHHEMYVTSKQALEVIPQLSKVYCEPFSDSSQIPTFLLSQFARKHVTVSLTGDAGDELFGGYGRYQFSEGIWSKVNLFPYSARKALSSFIKLISVNEWDTLLNATRILMPDKLKAFATGQRLHKFSELIRLKNMSDLYHHLIIHWKSDEIISYSENLPTIYTDNQAIPSVLIGASRLMYADILGYLCTDILVKVDRAGMANSLETRVPLLSPDIIAFSQRLPLEYKIRGNQSKWILRQVLNKYVPERLIDRPKMGFGIPLDDWLRGPLKDWVESLIGQKRLETEGILNPVSIRSRWKEHLDGSRNWAYQLWDVLMFQAWLDEQYNK